jgi:hypothetical protein
MTADAERCAEYEKLKKIDAALRAGDLAALQAAVDDPAAVPNGPMPLVIGSCLEYAIYHSPLSFIRTLLEIGADPNPPDHSGFPPLIAALSCSRPQPGAPGRPDVLEILRPDHLRWVRTARRTVQDVMEGRTGATRWPVVLAPARSCGGSGAREEPHPPFAAGYPSSVHLP